MTDLQTKVRKVAKQALHRWMHSEVDGNPMDEIADAVLTVTLQEVDTALRAKLTPALNTGTAMDMLVLVGETLRDLQSFGQAPREQHEDQNAKRS